MPRFNHGFTSTLRPILWNQYLVKNAWVLENWPRFTGCTPNPTSLHEFAQFLGCDSPPPPHKHRAKTCLLAWIYPGIGYVMHFLPPPLFWLGTCILFTHFSLGPSLKKMDVPQPLWVRPFLHYDLIFNATVMQCNPMGAEQIISVEKSWPNRKETLIISVKIQPNVIHSQLGVISVRNRISRLKKLCIIKHLWRVRHFVDQQSITAWWMRPRMPLKRYIVYMYSDARI